MGFRSALDGVLGRAAAQPEAPALLVDGRLAHTYGSLARAALRTGAILRDRGAGPEDIVGIALPRSAELVVAMLGAWPITLDPVFSGLAWALIFGLVVSTAFTLLLVPVVYWMLYKGSEGRPEAAPAAEPMPKN